MPHTAKHTEDKELHKVRTTCFYCSFARELDSHHTPTPIPTLVSAAVVREWMAGDNVNTFRCNKDHGFAKRMDGL